MRNPPHADWPDNARIALQFVLNYEEGGENNVLHGDAGSEQFLSEIIGAQSYPARHMSMESIYEYGSRAGVWRLLKEFSTRDLPLTVFGVAMAYNAILTWPQGWSIWGMKSPVMACAGFTTRIFMKMSSVSICNRHSRSSLSLPEPRRWDGTPVATVPIHGAWWSSRATCYMTLTITAMTCRCGNRSPPVTAKLARI